jgi:hypothetical protein
VEPDTFVVAYFHSPREQWWGLLRMVGPAGITLRGLPLDSFEPWARAIAREGEMEIIPTTVFFPLHRVERIYEDESSAVVASHADRFKEITGRDVSLHLFPVEGREQ